MTYNIAIVGLGNIGRRHLQGLLRIKYKIIIHLFEIKLSSIKETNLLIKQNKNKKIQININKNIVRISNNIDLLILATTSHQRYDLINTFTKLNLVKNILVEKLAFNNLLEYKKTIKLLFLNLLIFGFVSELYAQTSSDSATVTFQVDMSTFSGVFTAPEVNGTFNNWCGNCWAMSDVNNDNIWEISGKVLKNTPSLYNVKILLCLRSFNFLEKSS